MKKVGDLTVSMDISMGNKTHDEWSKAVNDKSKDTENSQWSGMRMGVKFT